MMTGTRLPKGWKWATINDLFAVLEDGRTLHQGWSPQCEKEPSQSDQEWGVLKTTSIQAGLFLPEHNKRLPDALTARPLIETKSGDLLVTCAGPRSRCGVACLVRKTRPRLMLSGKMYRFRVPKDQMDSRFVEAYLQTTVARDEIDRMKTGGSDSGLNLTHDRFRKLLIPVAPLNEQKRIVAKIEELLTQLDAGLEELHTAQAQLKRYRQAVLEAAISGNLTREWREAQKGEHESASELLARILQERRARWEKEQLAKIAASGKTWNNNDWKNKYKELAAPASEELLPLPFGWIWSSLGQVFGVHVGATPSRKRSAYWNGNLPWVSSSEVAFCRIKSTREKITEQGLQNTSTDLHPVGTVLLGMIGEGKTRGQAAILDIAACNSQNSAAIRVSEAGLPPEYIYYFLQSEYERTRKLGSGNNQPALNKSRVQAIAFPLPPLNEQQVIVQELERLLSIADAVQQSIKKELNKAASLRQSILKRAFEGKLVPQDPNDEPAELLLERIRINREKREAEKQNAAKLNRKLLTKNRSKRTERPAA